jgi:hypothetical protein
MTEAPEDSAHDPLPSTAPTEPAVNIGSWVAFASVVISVLVDLGVPLTDAQQRLVYLLAIFLAPVLSALVIRSKVYSPATVERIVQTMQARVRGADLDSADAVARQQAVELLYPAVHALVTGQAQDPQSGPQSGPQTAPRSPQGDPPVVYPLLAGPSTQAPLSGTQGRFDPDYYTEKTTAMGSVPAMDPRDWSTGENPYFGGRHHSR